MLDMKTFSEIYKDLKQRFKRRSNIDVTDGTVIDSYLLASAESLSAAHEEIENSKNPHIYTNLTGTNIDKMALLINCPRYANETDESYLYRCMKWTLINESSNVTAIESALSNLEESSNASYVPYTEGTGTATVFIIPNDYSSEEQKERAILEVKNRLYKVVSPDSYINYKICQALPIEVFVHVSFSNGVDTKSIQNNLQVKIKDYINKIAIGDTLSYGAINKIGTQEKGIEFFNTTHILIDGELLRELNAVQTIETKFLFYNINWTMVVE